MKKNMQKTISVFLSLLMLLSVFGVVAFAEGETTKEVSYVDASGAPQTVEATVTVPGSHYGVSDETGWYVIEGTYSGNGQLFFEDAVTNLILADDADWTITNSDLVNIGNVRSGGGTLNVFVQADNSATLHLSGGLISYNGAVNVYGGTIISSQRIGGSPSNGDFTASNSTLTGSLYGKNITLHNCTVTGYTGNCGGDFTIDGGSYTSVCESWEVPVRATNIVIANATVEGSGCQNGLQATGGSVTISNSTVNVTASNMAISGSGVSISGCNVTATASGNFGIYSSGPIEISGGTVSAEGGIFGLYGQSVVLNGGNVTASGNVAGVNAGSALTLGADVPDSSYTLGSVLSGATVTVKEGQTLTDGENDYTGTLTSDEVALLAGKTLTCKHVMADEWTCYDETRHVKVCTVCGGTLEYEDHDVIVRGAGDATCVNAGYTGDEYCSVCGERLSEGEVIQPTGNHSYDNQDWEYYDNHQHVHYCETCGTPEYVDHDVIVRGAGDATCVNAGYTGDEYCSVCGERLSEGEIIQPTGSHTTVLVNAMEATATEDGYTGDEVCTVCGNTIKTGTVIPRTGTETPTIPDESSNDNICKWDNVDHGTSFLGKIIKLFHSILYLITHLFGQGEGTIC